MSVNKRQAVDAFNLLCGRELGRGVYRHVFECKIDPSYVVKVEIDDMENGYRTFENVREMRNWEEYSSIDAVKKWLAPCHFLSPDGFILLQKRVEAIRKGEWIALPQKLPAFLTDLKYDNFGWLDGRLVCCDYSNMILNPSIAQRKADWWEQ